MPNPAIALLIGSLLMGGGLLLFWPERGLFWRWQRARQMTGRVLIEDALKHIHKCMERENCPTAESVAGALRISTNEAAELLAQMEARGLLHRQAGKLCLTLQGREYALRIIRVHRLWERYLADRTGYDEAEWHDQAHRYEHMLSSEEVEALAAQLGEPTYDPHGHPIPTADGQILAPTGKPLTAMGLDEPLRIVHLEDEPEAIYAQLAAEGLHPGMVVRLTEMSPQRVRFWAEGEEHVLAPILAANISVVPVPHEAPAEPQAGERLSELKPGGRAKIESISRAVRGPERRRLMDLGVLPGTLIEATMTSPGGDPTAYLVRGTLIALRRDQADMIQISQPQEAS